METIIIIFLLLALFTKHFFVDFPMQTPFQWQNKGTYLHPGGLLHSFLHGVGTLIVVFLFTFNPTLAIWLGVLDVLIHYHIDWAKMNINKEKGWKADKNPEFWTLLGLDQYLHAVTYLAFAAAVSIYI